VSIAAPLILRAALLPLFPAPEPRIHDEFSFLLAADTFAHGRLVNPPHPFWPHFESMHILTRPVYVSAFPIAQALLLAGGKVFGSPWLGVWLSTGLMCGAICWMLQGWVTARWALLGAALVVMRLGVSSYWMNSYWGGNAGAIGGALALGALVRLNRKARWQTAAAFAAGIAILAHSRPVEGAVFALVSLIVLWRVPLRLAVVLPVTLIGVAVGAGTAYYYARVTGKAWMMPYVLYRENTVAPHFVFEKPRSEPIYNNRELRNFYVYSELENYRDARNAPVSDLVEKSAAYWRFYVGPLLTIPLLVIPWAFRRDRAMRQALWILAGFSLAIIPQVWHNVHYASPVTGLITLIVVLGMRHLRLWRVRGFRAGLTVVRLTPVACALVLVLRIFLPGADAASPSWHWPDPYARRRASVAAQLGRMADKHLVFVRYAMNHDTGDEWVYNSADIDGSRVIWARELDRTSNEKLMRYFGDRRVWLIEPDHPAPRLIPYAEAPYRPMPFVAIGAPGIDVLRSAEELKRKLNSQHGGERYSCDGWNYFFAEITGVAGPAVTAECYGAAERSTPVSLDQWFAWARAQR